MTSLLVPILGFLICAILIVMGGSKLSYYGDLIAELTGLGKAWLGLVMMASITSLPELITGISAVLVVNAPDIAMGDVMGSCVFNLVILAVLDFLTPGKSIFSRLANNNVPAAMLGMLLLALAGAAITFPAFFPQLGPLNSGALLLALAYFAAVRLLFFFENQRVEHVPASMIVPPHPPKITFAVAVRRYILYALMVVGVAVALPHFAEQLAVASGLDRSFVGTLLVATATSLPELAVSIAALRIGSADMAAGNIFGSNLFNMLILFIDDLVFTPGSLFSQTSRIHGLSAFAAIIMTAIAGLAVLAEPGPKKYRLSTSGLLLVVVYLSLVVLLWHNQ